MRSLPLVTLLVVSTAASALPESNTNTQREAKRWVNVWNGHENEISKPALKPVVKVVVNDERQKGKPNVEKPPRRRKNWWKWNEEEEEDEDDTLIKTTATTTATSTTTTPGKFTKPIEPSPVFEPVEPTKSAITLAPVILPSPIKTKTTTTSTPKPEPTPAVALRPTYPKGISDPIPKDAWLLSWAAKVSPYWDFKEEAVAPCYDFGTKKSRTPCVPTCADIHSHTRLSVNIICKTVEICAFATFVLPDSQCPDRPNSYTTRCPSSAASLPDRITPQIQAALLDGTHIKPSGCKNPPPPTRRRRDLALRSPHRSLAIYDRALHKRVYVYRGYLNGMNMYRSTVLQGPSGMSCSYAHTNPDGTTDRNGRCPFDCSDLQLLAYFEYIGLNGTNYRLCVYPESTREIPEERCPGIGNPEENCPGSEQELVQFFVEKTGYSESKVRTMLKNETESNPPCTEENWYTVSLFLGFFRGGEANLWVV